MVDWFFWKYKINLFSALAGAAKSMSWESSCNVKKFTLEKIKSNSILLNSALPHFLNEWVASNNKRLIHLSTDCVFSGRKGNYLDNDIKDAYDLYGSTKSLGE